MREYVLFVILIFIPIGSLLYYFLRREGLPKKDISIILLLVLLIIFSFPICMERLGIYFSLLIYLIIIGALVAYLLRGGDSPYLETAFASLRNLRQRPELIIKSEPDLIVLNYGQLSEMPMDKLPSASGRVPEVKLPEEVETIPASPASRIVEEPRIESIVQSAGKMSGEPGDRTGVIASSAIAEGLPEDFTGEVENSLAQSEEVSGVPELAADELVEKMVARLAAKIESMPETTSQANNSEVFAEEQAELAMVVEIVKDVIAEAAVRIDGLATADIGGESREPDMLIAEPVAGEAESAVTPEKVVEATADRETDEEGIEDEGVVEAEAAPAGEVIEDLVADAPERAAVWGQADIEGDTAVLTEEAGAAADGETDDEAIEDEGVVEAEAVPAGDIIEDLAADAPDRATVWGQADIEGDTAVLIEEAGAAADAEIAEAIEVEDVVEAEAAPAGEVIEDLVADAPERAAVWGQADIEGDTAVLTEEAGAAADSETAEAIQVEDVVEAEAAPAGEIIEEIAIEQMAAEEVPELVIAEAEAEAEIAVISPDLEIAEDDMEESVVETEAVPAREIVEEGTVVEADAPDAQEPVVVQNELETIAATDSETGIKIVSGAEDVPLAESSTGEIAAEGALPVLEGVEDTPEPTAVVETIEDLFQEKEASEEMETLTGTIMLSEGIIDESMPGEAAVGEVAEPVGEAGEVVDLASASQELLAQPEQPAKQEAEDLPEEEPTAEAMGVSPGEAEEEIGGETESADHGEVNRLVDMAFHYKTMGDIQAAIEAFVRAWNKVESGELRYLITLELVDLYKECGCYDYAEQVLGNYLELGGHKSDIIYEINRQLNAIRFLATELTRLGMSGAPWAQVPRWIRMELEEALNQ